MLLQSLQRVLTKIKLQLLIMILSLQKVSLHLLGLDLLILLQYDFLTPLMVLNQRLIQLKLLVKMHQFIFQSLQNPLFMAQFIIFFIELILKLINIGLFILYLYNKLFQLLIFFFAIIYNFQVFLRDVFCNSFALDQLCLVRPGELLK